MQLTIFYFDYFLFSFLLFLLENRIIAPTGFEPVSQAPEARILDRYTTGLCNNYAINYIIYYGLKNKYLISYMLVLATVCCFCGI